jgi:hypothetical protein
LSPISASKKTIRIVATGPNREPFVFAFRLIAADSPQPKAQTLGFLVRFGHGVGMPVVPVSTHT